MTRRWLLAALALTLVPGAAASRARQIPVPSEIVAIDLAGRQANLTLNAAWDLAPSVSRDGRIAFVSTRDGGADLYVMDGDGGNVRRLTSSPFDDSQVVWEDVGITRASWSASGTRVAFDTAKASIPPGCFHDCVDWNVHVVDADGTNLRRVASSARSPAWSPAGRRLAYESRYDSYEHASSGLTITPAHGSKPFELRAFNDSPQIGPVWSPTGRELAFEAQVDEKGHPSLFVVGADGRHKRRLATGRNPSWSRDGHRIAFISNYRLITIGEDGKGKRRLSRDGAVVLGAAWSPTANALAVVTASSLDPFGGPPSDLRIETVSADSKRVRVLAREPAGSVAWSDPVWSPDGKRIVIAVG